ncbi:MAG: phosphopyruvate hydratase [Bdellovibrionaceae bacterium]|nr:phosphopyruvate hydratase [Pseudobdellovibrionaceae bacterium]
MYLSGKITNSFFTFLNRYELDTSQFFEMTALEIDFIRDPYSLMSAEQVELLLRNIQRAYQQRFIDKDLVTTVGHNAPHLKSWGGLESSLTFFDNLQSLYEKIDKFFSFFVSPPLLIYNKESTKDYFSFQTDFNKDKYPTVKDYFLSILETLPVFLGKDQTEAQWIGDQIKIYYNQEENLSLPLFSFQKTDPKFLISDLKAREVIDSRGQPTLEVDLICNKKFIAHGIVPSGASTGQFEARELRDKDPHYFFSKGLKKACQNVQKLSSVLKGEDVRNQKKIDQLLLKTDNSPYKENLGANTLLGISLACLRGSALLSTKALYEYASFKNQNLFLPVPLMNIVNGGVHGSNSLDVQEFMIVPVDFSSFKEALRAGCEVFYYLKQELKSKGFSIAVGDEGGFTPNFSSSVQAFDFLLSAIEKCSYTGKMALALDCASSEFYKENYYLFEGQKRNSEEMISIYEKWIKDYPLVSIEDGLAEEDWKGWQKMTKKLGKKIQLVGDDLFVTQKDRVEQGIEKGSANALLVKYNQVGTITETEQAILKAKSAGWTCVLSHRSGDTEDTSIADLSVAWATEQIKTGSVSRGERTAKYNRLLRIEEELDPNSFRGKKAFNLPENAWL